MICIGIAADHGGFELKVQLTAALKAAGYAVVDFGAPGQGGGEGRGYPGPGHLRQRCRGLRCGQQGDRRAGGKASTGIVKVW